MIFVSDFLEWKKSLKNEVGDFEKCLVEPLGLVVLKGILVIYLLTKWQNTRINY